MTTQNLFPQAVSLADHDIIEIRILPLGTRTDLYILFGMDDASRFGGWMRRSVDVETPAIELLLKAIATGDMEGWELGAPPTSQNREQHTKGKGEGSGKWRQRGEDDE